MEIINSGGWKVYINLFKNENVDNYLRKIVDMDYSNSNYSVKKNSFKHNFDKKYLPLIYDNLNNACYLALGFVYDEYGHLSFNRIEKRNQNYYIYISNKKYFDNKKGKIRVKIFNTFSLKHIFAASFPVKNREFILNYDNNNSFIYDIIPYDTNFIIDAEILREYKTFNENISFGEEIINSNMVYNKLKIKNIKFNKRECYGIIQGGTDHRFLYNLGKEINYNVQRI